jgi:hypothetical protein
MNHIQKKDLEFGDEKENNLLPKLNNYFNFKLKKTKPFYEFDYIDKNKKVLIELKARRNTKNKYPDTMIGYNKILKGLDKIKHGYKIYFVFAFTNCVSYYELTKDNVKNLDIRDGGRVDRDKDEIKKYAFIKIEQLINCFSKKNNAINIKPKMSYQKPMTNNEKPLSYSKRLIQHFEEAKEDLFSIEKINEMINDFSKLEYEKRKQNTDEMPFGKYKGKKVSDVAKFDSQYLTWLRKQDMMENYGDLKNEINKHM